MELTLNQIVASVPVLDRLRKSEFPIKISYRINLAIKSLTPFIEVFNDERDKLLNKLDISDFETAAKSKKDEFWKQINTILEEKMNVELEKVDPTLLGEFKMTPEELQMVDWLFDL